MAAAVHTTVESLGQRLLSHLAELLAAMVAEKHYLHPFTLAYISAYYTQ
jgi:hypothetical protein